MRTGCPKAPLVLTDPERHTREDLARRARTVPQVVRRAARRSGTICGPHPSTRRCRWGAPLRPLSSASRPIARWHAPWTPAVGPVHAGQVDTLIRQLTLDLIDRSTGDSS